MISSHGDPVIFKLVIVCEVEISHSDGSGSGRGSGVGSAASSAPVTRTENSVVVDSMPSDALIWKRSTFVSASLRASIANVLGV